MALTNSVFMATQRPPEWRSLSERAVDKRSHTTKEVGQAHFLDWVKFEPIIAPEMTPNNEISGKSGLEVQRVNRRFSITTTSVGKLRKAEITRRTQIRRLREPR